MNPVWLMRAKRLLQNPPSWQRVKLGLAIAAMCLAIYGFEQVFGWPEALTPQRTY